VAETEDNVNEEQAPEAETPADEAAPEAEAPAEEAAPEAEEAPAEEAAAEEPEEEAAPEEEADEPAAEEPAPAAAADEPEVEEEQLTPKQARKRARSTHTGEALPQRSTEERVAERSEQRARKAAHRRAYRAKQRERRAGEPRAEAPAAEPRATGKAKVRQGIVVSDRADKTITVRIDVASRHRKYKKIVRTSSTLHAHDENNDAHIGDTVRLIESRPLSRTKRWRLVEVLERAK
jgi:small subunit ribosomal protein S17